MLKQKKEIRHPASFDILTEEDRLKKDIYRSDMEKFRLFTAMLRRNAVLKKAIIRH